MVGRDALHGKFLRPRKRGEPLVMFLTLMMIWMGGRTLTWRDLSMTVRPNGSAAKLPGLPAMRARPWPQVRRAPLILPAPHPSLNLPVPAIAAHMPAPLALTAPLPATLIPSLQPLTLPQADPMAEAAGTAKVRGAVAQQMLYLAAMANLPLPAALQARQSRTRNERRGAGADPAMPPVLATRHAQDTDALVVARQNALPSGGRLSASAQRWSGDGWLLMRQGGDSHALVGGGAPYGPTYGANQVGAVLRYRLVAGEPHKLTAYTRAYGALNGTGEREAAAGLSLRPIPAVPVIAMAEIRASQFQSGQVHARPAVSLVTEMAPIALLGRVEAETYVQAGYVGGAASTPFVDGQVRVEQVVDYPGRAQLRLGLGAWGGAQTGANRLDIGPTVRIGFVEGRVGARVAIDYRLRVKGNARPTSGPAITLSAGF